jgi:hypothetical protein
MEIICCDHALDTYCANVYVFLLWEYVVLNMLQYI